MIQLPLGWMLSWNCKLGKSTIGWVWSLSRIPILVGRIPRRKKRFSDHGDNWGLVFPFFLFIFIYVCICPDFDITGSHYYMLCDNMHNASWL